MGIIRVDHGVFLLWDIDMHTPNGCLGIYSGYGATWAKEVLYTANRKTERGKNETENHSRINSHRNGCVGCSIFRMY
jgi:hypothetical protein